MIQAQENGEKTYFGHDLSSWDQSSRRQYFFSKYLASLVTRFHGQLSSCTISESLLLLIYLWLTIKIQLKVYLWVQM